MKAVFIMLCLFFTTHTFAAESLQLECQSKYGQPIMVSVTTTDKDHYLVDFSRSSFPDFKIDNQRVEFDEVGSIVIIEATAVWEGIRVAKVQNQWTGTYWYDLANYPVVCKELE